MYVAYWLVCFLVGYSSSNLLCSLCMCHVSVTGTHALAYAHIKPVLYFLITIVQCPLVECVLQPHIDFTLQSITVKLPLGYHRYRPTLLAGTKQSSDHQGHTPSQDERCIQKREEWRAQLFMKYLVNKKQPFPPKKTKQRSVWKILLVECVETDPLHMAWSKTNGEANNFPIKAGTKTP